MSDKKISGLLFYFDKYTIIDYNSKSSYYKYNFCKGKSMLNDFKNRKKQVLGYFFIVFLILLTDIMVYLDGGSQSVLSHFMYIPILLAAFLGERKYSFMTAILGGLTLGPFMYKNMEEGITQTPKEWIFRLFIFCIVGYLTGLLLEEVKKYEVQKAERKFFNDTIGLANANQLKIDLPKQIKTKEAFSLVAFQIANMDHINRYVDYTIGEESLKKVIRMFLETKSSSLVYSICNNEFAAIFPQTAVSDTYKTALEFLEKFKEPISVCGFIVEIIMKVGIVHCPSHSCCPDELFKKMELALDEAPDSSEPYIYDEEAERKNKEKYEIQLSLHEAIQNEEFYLVYQPKICLNENKVIGIEALLRWRHPDKGIISPEKFIPIAENIGIINEITKWVIENTIRQLTIWQKKGITVNAAINFSSKDMKNSDLVRFATEFVKENDIEPQRIELEITERGIIKNLDFVSGLLNEARKFGFTISMDDFGTGYNSLRNLIQLPIDYLKIDKFFIDQISEANSPDELKNIIHMAHKLGIQVIAEGVESHAQLQWLKQNNCDYIQGYYFSKPLPADELEAYLKDFSFSFSDCLLDN